MKLTEIIKIIEGRLFNKNVSVEREICGVCGADLMSDVLPQPNRMRSC
jgi:hypothetical protein